MTCGVDKLVIHRIFMLFYMDHLLPPIDTLRTLVNMSYNVAETAGMAPRVPDLIMAFVRLRTKALPVDNFLPPFMRWLR